jgi:hypothetical protein
LVTGAGEATSLEVHFPASDDLSGVQVIQAGFLSLSGNQTQTGSIRLAANTSVTGAVGIAFPKDSEPDTWTLRAVYLSDAAGNTACLTLDDLFASRFPYQVTVTNVMDPPAK